MSDYIDRLDETFSLETAVLNEVTNIPVGDLNRILNQSEVKRIIKDSGKGNVGELWNDMFDGLKKGNKGRVQQSLAGLIVGYSLMMQFLGQPRNKRLVWLKSFLKNSQGSNK